MDFLKKIGLEPFIIMLFGSILLAYIYPPIGIEREGGVSLGEIANWGVSFIFFFYGMRLNRDKLKAGLVNVRLHILVHMSTFVLFPLIMLAAMWAGGAFDFPRNAAVYGVVVGGDGIDSARKYAGGDFQCERIEPSRCFHNSALDGVVPRQHRRGAQSWRRDF